MATNNSCDYSPVQYTVQIGGANGTLANVTAGTTGQVLTGVTGGAPTFQSPSASAITITGDTGGGLTGSSFTFTGSTTGLTFAGSGSTETLGGTLVVGNGGTGAATFTSHGVLLGNTTSAITATAAGTTGQVLTGVTGSAPTFQSPAASSITITGNSGGGLTGNSFTFTGGTTGITFSGSGTTEILTGTLVLANGGTSASLTASNGGIFYSTASAGAILSGTATADQVLLSGSSTTPAWSTATYPATTTINQLLYSSANNVIGGVTAGDYGVLISSSSGVPSWLANGTTGQVLTATTSGTPSWAAASGGVTGPGSSTTRDIATWNGSTGSALYDNPGVTISSAGALQNTNQPAFFAYLSANASSVTGDGTTYTIAFNETLFDQASNFNTGTATFTAPVTGIYQFNFAVELSGLLVAHNYMYNVLITTARTYIVWDTNPYALVSNAGNLMSFTYTVLAKMSATDTATVQVRVSNGTKVVTVDSNGSTDPRTWFSGHLVC